MVVNGQGEMFDDRRQGDRRQVERRQKVMPIKTERRTGKDRRQGDKRTVEGEKRETENVEKGTIKEELEQVLAKTETEKKDNMAQNEDIENELDKLLEEKETD